MSESTKLINLNESSNQNMEKKLKSIFEEYSLEKEKENKNQVKSKLIKIKEYIERKIFALIVVVLACILLYYTRLINNLHDDNENLIYRPFLYIGLIGYAILFIIIIILSIYPPIANLPIDEWNQYNDKVTPYLTALIIFSILCLCISIWKIYDWYSIPLLIYLNFSFIMTFQFAPGGFLGNIFFIIALVLFIFSGHLIEYHLNTK